MRSLDLRVLSDALAWGRAGHAVTLVTAVRELRPDAHTAIVAEIIQVKNRVAAALTPAPEGVPH